MTDYSALMPARFRMCWTISVSKPFTFKMLFLWAREDGEWWSHGEMFVLGEFALDQQSH